MRENLKFCHDRIRCSSFRGSFKVFSFSVASISFEKKSHWYSTKWLKSLKFETEVHLSKIRWEGYMFVILQDYWKHKRYVLVEAVEPWRIYKALKVQLRVRRCNTRCIWKVSTRYFNITHSHQRDLPYQSQHIRILGTHTRRYNQQNKSIVNKGTTSWWPSIHVHHNHFRMDVEAAWTETKVLKMSKTQSLVSKRKYTSWWYCKLHGIWSFWI